MILSIILGTIIWGALLAFISKKVTIFATPKAWIISWFVVIFVVIIVRENIATSNAEKVMIKEAERIEGAYSSSDGNVGIRALTDDGRVNMDGTDGFLVAFYNEDGTTDIMAIFYPKKKEVLIQYVTGGQESALGSYKYSGLFSKRLVIKTDLTGKVTYKKKSGEWNYFLQ